MNDKENGINILIVISVSIIIGMLYLIASNFDEFIIFSSQFLV